MTMLYSCPRSCGLRVLWEAHKNIRTWEGIDGCVIGVHDSDGGNCSGEVGSSKYDCQGDENIGKDGELGRWLPSIVRSEVVI